MQIKEEPLAPIADVDAEFKSHAKFVDVSSIPQCLWCS